MDDSVGREELLDYARQFGLTNVMVRRSADETEWYGYVRVLDASVTGKPITTLIREMPVVSPTASKLEVLLTLRQAGSAHGLVRDAGGVRGIVSERGLVEQMFRPPVRATALMPGTAGTPAG